MSENGPNYTYAVPAYAVNVRFKAVMLTPEWAERLLGKNHPRNRGRKERKIIQMVHDIINGDWVMTPEPVVISDADELLDGQNRCDAVVRAGIAVPVWVCSNIPAVVMKAMDTGTSRGVADVAKITGLEIRGINGVAGVARRMAQGTKPYYPMSIQETLTWIDVHAKSLAFTWDVLPSNKVGLTPAGVRAAVARAYYRSPVAETRKRLEAFGRILLDGLPDNRDEDEAAIRLRNWLLDAVTKGMRGNTMKAKPNPKTVYAKTETALNAFLERRSIDKLHETSKELFPLQGENAEEESV